MLKLSIRVIDILLKLALSSMPGAGLSGMQLHL